jgi:rfaE bifunctional protein nucleotidyltransferase chain/domain
MGQIVLDHDDLARRVRSLRAGGRTVVVTNGCFDLLHVGHVRCLTDAATRGDCLIVALNGDASVRKLKGAGRPLQPQAERAEILAAIQGVSYVTIFEEESVGPLLRKLRPQVLAKGTDYDASNLPERDVLAEIGAELISCGDRKSHATVDLIAKLRRVAAKPAAPSRAAPSRKPVAVASGKRPKPAHAAKRAVATKRTGGARGGGARRAASGAHA